MNKGILIIGIIVVILIIGSIIYFSGNSGDSEENLGEVEDEGLEELMGDNLDGAFAELEQVDFNLV